MVRKSSGSFLFPHDECIPLSSPKVSSYNWTIDSRSTWSSGRWYLNFSNHCLTAFSEREQRSSVCLTGTWLVQHQRRSQNSCKGVSYWITSWVREEKTWYDRMYTDIFLGLHIQCSFSCIQDKRYSFQTQYSSDTFVSVLRLVLVLMYTHPFSHRYTNRMGEPQN